MEHFKTYKGNEQYYKDLISKINNEINFPNFLSQQGYLLEKKSASYYEFRKNEEKIVVKINSTPHLYFDRNGFENKYLTFENFLKNKVEPNFYKRIKLGLEYINRDYEIHHTYTIKKNKAESLIEKFEITKDLDNSNYLTKDRMIDKKTLELGILKGRIFNAYYKKVNGNGSIPNIAFPMYNTNGDTTNYRLYHKDYIDKTTNKPKKFRIVLNSEKGNDLFHTNVNLDKIDRVYTCENEIDAISLIELKKDLNAVYVVLGGGIGPKKKTNFYSLFLKIQKQHPNISIVHATDNDGSGLHYDIELSAYTISKTNKNVDIEYKNRRPGLDFVINYKNTNIISNDYNDLKSKMETFNELLNKYSYSLDWIQFKDKLKLSINNPKNKPLNSELKKTIVEVLNSLNLKYNKIPTKILKSNLKDWNDDLKHQKKKLKKEV